MKNKLKYIAHITSYYPPHLGGMENCVKEISEKQAEKKYNVKVFTSNIGAEDRKRRDTKNHQVFYLKSREFAHTPIIPSLFGNLLKLKKQSIMHIHVSQAFTPEIVFLVSKLKKIPYVAHIHLDVDPTGRFGFLLKPYKKLFLTHVLRNAARVICLSESQKKLIAQKYAIAKTKIDVLTNGVGKEFFIDRTVVQKDIPTILFVGRFTSQKNVPRLLQAIALMKQKVHVNIVGEGEDREEIESLKKILNLSNVRLLGKKTGEELRKLYKYSDIFVLTSNKEGIPLVLLEAMAAGLPIVASDIDGVRELLGDTGILVADPSAETFASALDALTVNTQQQSILSHKTYERAKKFTWGMLVGKLDRIYDKALTVQPVAPLVQKSSLKSRFGQTFTNTFSKIKQKITSKIKPAQLRQTAKNFINQSKLFIHSLPVRSIQKVSTLRLPTINDIKNINLFAFFKQNPFFARIIILICVTNILLITNTNPFFIRDILAFIVLLFLPGILLIQILKIKATTFWEYASFMVGLSLSFLMITGLLINQILPIFHNFKPLAEIPVVSSITIALTILMIAAYKRNRIFNFQLPALPKEKYTPVFFVLLLLFPVLAILGAVSLNNGGTSLFDEVLFGGIGVYVLALIILRNKVASFIFPTSLYCIGLALLFSTSLRSWYIAGHDVQLEYFVFQLSKFHHYWNMNYYRDAYNACMSITILPTVLSDFFRFNDIYIYKFIFQIIFAICPVIMYLFLRNYTTKVIAFIATFYFLAFPTFYNDMPMLNRQEIGFIFFSLVLLVSFSKTLPRWIQTSLFLLFGFSVIISHYSTNYVLLFLFLGSYSIAKVLNLKITSRLIHTIFHRLHIRPKNHVTDNAFLNGFALICLFLLTFFWNTIFTQTSNNIQNVAGKVIKSIFISSPQDAKSTDTVYTLFFSHKTDPKKILSDFINRNIQIAQQEHEDDLYTKKEYQNYPIHPVNQPVSALTGLGKFFTNIHLPLFTIYSLSRGLAAKAIQIMVFIGLLGFLFYKNHKLLDKKYILFCISGIILLILEILLPSISLEYGLLRMFQQLLLFLAFPIVIATLMLTKYLGENKSLFISAGIAVIFFLTLTGFFSAVTGGYYPQMELSNDGMYYYSYFINKQDNTGANWLEQHKTKQQYQIFQADIAGTLQLLNHGNTYVLEQVFPPLIRRNAYVYLTNSNMQNKAIVSIDNDVYLYNSPESFLDDHKNMVYNNGKVKIYK